MSSLDDLLAIPRSANALFPRGGAYSPDLNVWVVDGFADYVESCTPSTRRLLDALASAAIAAGSLHRTQVADGESDRLWPRRWIEEADGAALVDFCTRHPNAALPYACVGGSGQVVPYSAAYRDQLARLCAALDAALASRAPAVQPLVEYVVALQHAYSLEPTRVTDLEAFDKAAVAWVEIPSTAPLLLLAEFTEDYSDPLQPRISSQPAVAEWAERIVQRLGSAPWRTFFELRVLELADSVVHAGEIEHIRATNRDLYASLSDLLPAEHAKTEFRRAIMTGGHGANPPKSAKNYPNRAWIRSQVGYRNVIFVNQVEEKVRHGMLPALQAAFDTGWVQAPDLYLRMMRANALSTVAHEETHPWARFDQTPWLEELKSDVLGMFSLVTSPGVEVDPADLIVSAVAAALFLHRYHHFLLAKGDHQFEDYYVGDSILLTHLLRGGFFRVDHDGMIGDVDRMRAGELLSSLAERIMAIRRGHESPLDLYRDLYAAGQVFERFRGWVSTQASFEALWTN